MFFLTDDNDDDEEDDDANSDNGGEVSRRKEKGKEVMVKGERLVNIYQLLSAYCLEFYFSDDGPRVISSFPF